MTLDYELDISVIIPAYNVGQYINDALESVLSQQPAFRHVIVIDDGSTDNTGAVVRRFDDPRVIYHYQINRGVGAARNMGLALCNSEFIYFMDADDVLAPGMVAHFGDALAARPELDLFAFSAVDFEHVTGKTVASSRYYERKASGFFKSGVLALRESLEKDAAPACVFLNVFRRSAIEGVVPLRFLSILHEDELFTPALFLSCGATVVSKTVYYYRRVRSCSIMTTAVRAENVVGVLEAARWWRERLNGRSPREDKLFFNKSYYLYAKAVLYASRAGIPKCEFRRLIASHAPCFTSWSGLDIFNSRISRKITFWSIIFRARIISFFRVGTTA